MSTLDYIHASKYTFLLLDTFHGILGGNRESIYTLQNVPNYSKETNDLEFCHLNVLISYRFVYIDSIKR